MSWTLLHPGWWPVLAVAAIPLVVHLISRRKARDLRFAAIEFVLRSQRRTARRIQLRQYLLLLARTLALAALALAILGPVRRNATVDPGARGVPTRHALAVDLTASMQAEVDGRPRWKRSVQQASAWLRALPPDEPVAVVACAGAPVASVEPPSFDRAQAQAALDAMAVTLDAGDLPSCLLRARAALGKVEGPARITLFSDAARHGWPADQQPDLRGTALEVVRPDDDTPANHAVQALLATPAPQAGPRALSITAQVNAWPATPGETRDVVLELDGQVQARGTLELSGNGPWERRFTHLPPRGEPAGVHDVAVSLPPDAMAWDNRLQLPVKVTREVRVLVVDGDPQAVAWRDEVFYLERALTAPSRGGGVLVTRILAQAPTPADIDGSDVVMLCNVRSLPRESVTALERHVQRGGGLFISGGDRVDVDFYNSALGELLPQPLRGEKSRQELEGAGRTQALGLGEVLADHPVFAPFSGQRPEGLARAQTHTVLLLETGSRAQREVLARFSNEAPALVERSVGQGRVILLATSVDRDWSDLAIRPGFLPLMHQVVLYLADALEDLRPRHVALGQSHVVPIRRGVARVQVVAPSGQVAEVPFPAGAAQVNLPPAREPGIHHVLMAPEGGDPVEVPGERFAAWPPSTESDLAPLSREDVATRLPAGVQLVGGGGSAGGPEQPAWPWLLVLLQLALVAEALLVRRG